MKSRSLLLFVLLLIAFVHTSCSSTDTPGELYIDKGKYSIQVYDRGKEKLAEGFFEISNIEGDKLSGTYTFTKVYQQSQLLRENQTQDLAGTLSKDRKQAFINTNPRLADANVFITLTAGLYSYFGEWNYSTYVGIVDEGTVRASKIE